MSENESSAFNCCTVPRMQCAYEGVTFKVGLVWAQQDHKI